MKKILYFLALLLSPASLYAQGDDVGMWYSVATEKHIDKQWSIGAEAEFRTRNDMKTADRWSLGIDGEHKFSKRLKASAGYTFLWDNFKEDISLHSDGSYNNWRPGYWGPKHRFHADLTGNVNLGRFNVSLRERWQYTYRPRKTTDRYDFDNEEWEEKTVRAKGKNVLRSRLQAEYDIPGCKADPYASLEMYNAWAVEKLRYTIGVDWKIKKVHTLGLYYRYQDIREGDEDNEPDSHIIGLSYKFKF